MVNFDFNIVSGLWLLLALIVVASAAAKWDTLFATKYDTAKGPCGSKGNGGPSQKADCCESQWSYCNVGSDFDKVQCMKDRGCTLTKTMCSNANINYSITSGDKNKICGGTNWGGPPCREMCCKQQWEFCKNGSTKGQCMKDRGCPLPAGEDTCKVLDYSVSTGDKNTHCGTGVMGGKECMLDCARAQAVYCNNNGGPKNMQCMLDRGVPLCESAEDVACYPNVYSNLTEYRGNKWSRNGGNGCTSKVWDFDVTPNLKKDSYGKVQCGLPQQGGKKCKQECCYSDKLSVKSQKNFCKGSNTTIFGGFNKSGYETCMKQRGCKP